MILRIVKPPGNKQKGKFAKSEDLRRRFTRDYYAEMRIKLGDLLGKQPRLAPLKQRIAKVVGRKPVLSQYPNGPTTLCARYKGKTLFAYVRKTGLIFFAGRYFTSPSVAGSHAIKGRACNGWKFWEYQRAPGDWVALDNLRK